MAKIRYPLVQAFGSRNGVVLAKDPYVINGVARKYNDKLYIIKRPGNTPQAQPQTGTPQGAFIYNSVIYEVIGDSLYLSGLTNNLAKGDVWTQATAPPWINRYGTTACVFNNRMWMFGGVGNFASSIWSSQDGQTWAVNAGGQPWGQRYGGQVVVFNNKMWFMGGFNASTNTAFSDVWNTSDGQTWTQVTAAAPWSQRYLFNAVSNQTGIFVSMGLSVGGARNNEVWFSSDGLNWVQLAGTAVGVTTPWSARSGAGLVWFKNLLTLYGGTGGSGNLNDVWQSPDGINWVQGPNATWSPRFFFATCVYNGSVWVFGGQTPGYNNEVWSSTDPGSLAWTQATAAATWSVRAQMNALVFRVPQSVNPGRYQDLWLLGGTNASNPTNEVWYANINSTTSAFYNLAASIPNQAYQFATFNNGQVLLIKNQSNFWIFSAGVLTKITDQNYPPTTVPGIVVLNQFAYVMTPEKEIHACQLNDATTWPALQYTVAGYEDDPGVCIAKYLNYLVVFGQQTIMYYYDNSNPPPGVSISPYINANQRTGAVYANTIQNSSNSMFFVGQTSHGNTAVYTLEGVTPKKISDEWVDGVLQNGTPIVSSFVLSMDSHSFYVLNTVNYSMVYDIDKGWWSVWLDASGAFSYPFAFCVSDTAVASSAPYLIRNDGGVYRPSFSVFSDAIPAGGTASFTLGVQTDKLDDNNMVSKFWGRLDWVADRASNPGTSLVTIQLTDDDYQNFKTWGQVDEASTRPSLTRGGSSRRRAFLCQAFDQLYHRWEAIELTYSEGES